MGHYDIMHCIEQLDPLQDHCAGYLRHPFVENDGFCERISQVLADAVGDLIVRDTAHVARTRLFMLKAECPYIPPRSETEGEADFLHASSEDVLVRLLS